MDCEEEDPGSTLHAAGVDPSPSSHGLVEAFPQGSVSTSRHPELSVLRRGLPAPHMQTRHLDRGCLCPEFALAKKRLKCMSGVHKGGVEGSLFCPTYGPRETNSSCCVSKHALFLCLCVCLSESFSPHIFLDEKAAWSRCCCRCVLKADCSLS